MRSRGAFTLIEMIMALAACAVILAAVYGVFTRAIHLRNAATERARESRSRAHAAAVIASDLRNAWFTKGTLATIFQGSSESHGSTFPGSVKFAATNAREAADAPRGDVQGIEYYVVTDPNSAGSKAGLLVRAVNTNLLAATGEVPTEVPLLPGVEAMELSFFDGTAWTDTWDLPGTNTTLPEAVRVTIRQASSREQTNSAPLEVLSLLPAPKP